MLRGIYTGSLRNTPGAAKFVLLLPTPYMSQAIVISLLNMKGGVGKTTTAVNLAASLAAAEQRTLLVDGDPQGNASSGIGLEREAIRETTYDVLLDPARIETAIVPSVQFQHLDVLPATPDLAGAEVELVGEEDRERAMRRGLDRVRDRYDYILIDCPPSLGLITVNMLAAADAVVIPLQCEYYALEGLSQLMATIRLVRERLNPALQVNGLLLTMLDPRTKLGSDVVREVESHFGELVYKARVPRSVRLAEAPSHGIAIRSYAPGTSGAESYAQAAAEFDARVFNGTPVGAS